MQTVCYSLWYNAPKMLPAGHRPSSKYQIMKYICWLNI